MKATPKSTGDGDLTPHQPHDESQNTDIVEKSETIRTPRTKDRPYFPSARKSAQDSRLSFDARGALWYLLSKPDDWQVIVGDLMREGGIGRDKVKRILKELRDCGYLETELTRDDDGVFTGKVDRLHETAIHSTENPSNGKPVQRKTRKTVNPKIQNTDSLKNEESNVSAGDNQSDSETQPPKAKRTRKPDPIFDTLAELHWNIHDTAEVDKTTAIRINKIKAWLKENSPGATAETLRAFVTWFCEETEGKASPPRDVAKFAERFVEFREYRQKQAQAPAPTPLVKIADLFSELDGA